MTNNPIVDEIHRVREEIMAEFGGDLAANVHFIQTQTDQHAAAGHAVVTHASELYEKYPVKKEARQTSPSIGL